MPRDPVLIPGNSSPTGGGFGGDRVTNFSGGPRDQPPVFNSMPRVQDLKVRLLGSRRAEITWRTVGSDVRIASPVYSVRFTSDTVAGSEAGDQSWAQRVYDLSKEIDQRPYTRTGVYRVIFDGTDYPDGWIVVSTVYNGTSYEYSNPVRCQFSVTTAKVPPNISGQIFAISANSYLYRGFYVNSLQMAFSWIPPSDAADFAGVALHVKGLNGATDPVELSAFQTWDQTRQLFTPIINLPLETGRVNGSATFTNGSTAIVRISGSAFVAGDVGRRVVVFNTNGSVFEGFNNVATFTDGSHITQAAPFGGSTGSYTFRILNTLTAYFVSASKNGARVGDYTTAPNAVA